LIGYDFPHCKIKNHMKTLTYQSKKPVETIKIVSFSVLLIVGFLFSSFSCNEDDIETEPETMIVAFGAC